MDDFEEYTVCRMLDEYGWDGSLSFRPSPDEDFRTHLAVDIETYSSVDLAESGVYAYTEAPDFEILLLAYAWDDEPVQIVGLADGERMPEDLLEALTDPSVTKSAFNANFERTCLARHFNRPMPPEQWMCTKVHAATLGLPGSLEGVAQALGLEQQKDAAGKALIRYFSVPCRPTKRNGGRTRNLPRHDRIRWELFKRYCKQDVEVERAIRKRLEKYPVPETERRLWFIDQRINDRGVRVELGLAKNAVECDSRHQSRLVDEARALTGLENPNSLSQLKDWLSAKGLQADSLGKDNLPELMKAAGDETVRRVLEIRKELGKTSVKKYEAMLRAACRDGRVRGLLQFYGANRTGRWCLAEGALVLVCTKEGDVLEKPIETVLLTDQVWDGERWVTHEGVVCSGEKEVVSWDGITATPEHIVYLSDAERTTLGEAKEKGLRLWRGQPPYDQKPDVPYKGHQEKAIMRTYDIINAGPKNRFMANGRIVSNSGRLVQIQNLPRNSMKDLDLARQLLLEGEYEMLEMLYESVPEVLSQLIRTAFIPEPGHRFLVADFSAIEARCVAWLAGEEWVLEAFRTHGKIYEATAAQMFGVPMERIVKGNPEYELRQKGKIATLACIAEGQLVLTDRGLVPIEQVQRSDKVWDGVEFVPHQGVVCQGVKEVITYDGLTATPDHLVWVEGQSEPVRFEHAAAGGLRLLRTGTVQVGGPDDDRQKARVYDLMNAGPRSRYTVSGRLVHNCGYGGGTGALEAMGALRMGLQPEELPGIILRWREANPKIVQFWSDVEKAAVTAVLRKREIGLRNLTFSFEDGTLFLRLPSGRRLAYVNARVERDGHGREVLTYEGYETGKWTRLRTYGGRLVENVTQSVARDCLAEAIFRLDAAGYNIVFHVHDEIVAEMPDGKGSVEEMVEIMSQPIDWAPGLPLAADGYECRYYKKD